jgi:hypothetical protein
MGIARDQLPKPGLAIMWCYVGLAAGDLASGLLSQLLRSRRRALLAFHVLTAAAIAAYFTVPAREPGAFYAICAAIGFGCGYWAVFVTTTAEQFGTNLRATAATSAPNFVRWSAAGQVAGGGAPGRRPRPRGHGRGDGPARELRVKPRLDRGRGRFPHGGPRRRGPGAGIMPLPWKARAH